MLYPLMTCDIRPFTWAEPKLVCPIEKGRDAQEEDRDPSVMSTNVGGSPKPLSWK